MNYMKSILAILFSIMLILAGCTNDGVSESPTPSAPTETEKVTSPVATEEPQESKETTNHLDINIIEASTENKYEATVSEFDLGKMEYTTDYGRVMPYNIKGIIGVPEGEGPFPLVLITHGSHSNDDESKRFDTGYDYLVKYMAKNGYITVSMDMSKPYIWKYGDNDDRIKSIPVANDHMESLLKANDGNNPGYPVELEGKIDLEKIGLIGHSRGGETIYDIAIDQSNRDVDIKAILAIAPTLFFKRDWPDVDVAILVPEYDGDIIQLDGFSMYRVLNSERQGLGNHYVTMLMGANHNYFNRNIERNDATFAGVEDISDQLTREQQESFLVKYAVGFFDSTFMGKNYHFINAHNPQPEIMYSFDVTAMFKSSQAVDLVDVKTTDDFIAAESIDIEYTIDSWFYKDDKVIIDTVTSGIEPYNLRPLINMKWEKSGSSVTITPSTKDFSDFSALTLDMVIDSADELNQADTSQRFTIGLKDANRNLSKIVLPENLNALAKKPGKVDSYDLDGIAITNWSVATPLSSINLPLSEFKDVDLKQIESIELIFDQTASGSIYIDSIFLQ